MCLIGNFALVLFGLLIIPHLWYLINGFRITVSRVGMPR